MTEDLPSFRCHPDPLSTGSVVPSDAVCLCCNKARGFVYVGPVNADEDLDDQLCPWCIASGDAHNKFDATFMDEGGVGGYGDWEAVSQHVVDEVCQRTPAFMAWQQESWFTCCEDAAAFLGHVGRSEQTAFGTEAVEALRRHSEDNGLAWDDVLPVLSKEGSPTGYLFKCTHCGAHGGYWDSH